MSEEILIRLSEQKIWNYVCFILLFSGMVSCEVWGQTQNAEASSRSAMSSNTPENEISQNDEIILQRFQNAAQRGEVSAQYNMGLIYYHGRGVAQNFNIALHWFQQAAGKEHMEAQFYIGYMHYYGKGTPQDYARAVEWFFHAAEQEHAAAQYYLGFMYYFGRGVAQNFAEAFKWFEKSARQFHPPAQYYLGLMHERGKYVEKDTGKAIFWYQKAVDTGDLNAKRRLAKLEEQLVENQTSKTSAILHSTGDNQTNSATKDTKDIDPQVSTVGLKKTTGPQPGKQSSRIGRPARSIQLIHGTTPVFVCDSEKWGTPPKKKKNTKLLKGQCNALRTQRDYSHCDFREADLSSMNLRGSSFKGADLTKANLQKSNLEQVDLQHGLLAKASLKGANLIRANLSGANLQGANLEGVIACQINLDGAKAVGAFLYRADLHGASMLQTNLSGAFLVQANLNRASLISAWLRQARLRGARLQNALLHETNFNGALGIPQWLLPHLTRDGELHSDSPASIKVW